MTTLQDIYNSRIPAAVGLCAGSSKLLAFINEAVERLLWEGKYWGTYAKFNICATNGCITLPRQISTIEAVAVCRRPIPIHDLWFEFLQNGFGTRDGCSCWPEANYKGQYPVFSEIIPQKKTLNFICDLSADIGQTVLALGYDDNGNWIRTLQNGVYADGEMIALNTVNGSFSQNYFSVVTNIQFQSARSGQCWLYEYDTTLLTKRMIGQYQYDEMKPSYGRYYFPSVNQMALNGGTCCGGYSIAGQATTPSTILVEIIGKKAFIPVANPTDYLIIGNIPALKEMIISLNMAENQKDANARVSIIANGTALAKAILDKELSHYLGDGRKVGINVIGFGNPDGCPVENFI